MKKVACNFFACLIFYILIFEIILLGDNILAPTSSISAQSIWEKNFAYNQIQQYKKNDIVMCLDQISIKTNNSVHFAFIGDSLVRNQFLNLISLIPDYDWNMHFHIKEYESHFHEDRVMNSQLLNNLSISFKWRAMINNNLISDFTLWTILEAEKTPDFIFLGSTVHNMLEKNYLFFEQMEKNLVPVLLGYLSAHPHKQLFWVIQSPTTDLLGPISEPNNYIINVNRIHHYNGIIRRIFKGTRVILWESLLPSIEEYIRSCFLVNFERYDIDGYELCDDYIHPGHQVLSIGSQLILNHVCNSCV